MTHIKIYNICNQMCVHCPNPSNVKNKVVKKTTDQDIRKQLELAKNQDSVLFTGGGEPTMVGNLPKFISLAKELGIRTVGLETNGMLLAYPDYIKEIKVNGLDFCIVSLHSQSASISDRITQVPGGFNLTMKGIENLRENNIPLTMVLHTLSSLNYRDFALFVEFISEMRVTELGVSFIRPVMDDAKTEKITPKISDALPFIHKGLKLAEGKNIKVHIVAGLGIPVCMLEGFEHNSNELLVYANSGRDEHEKQSYAYEKVKSDSCKNCSFDCCCAGLQKSYVKIHGLSELKPRKADLQDILNNVRKYHG